MPSGSCNIVTGENWEAGTDCLQPPLSDLGMDWLQKQSPVCKSKVASGVFIIAVGHHMLHRKKSTIRPLREREDLRGLSVSQESQNLSRPCCCSSPALPACRPIHLSSASTFLYLCKSATPYSTSQISTVCVCVSWCK